MSYDDFCRSTPEELSMIFKTWQEHDEAAERQAWERARILAAIIIQPHTKKKLTPRQLLPLPWDKEDRKKPSSPAMSREAQRERMLRVAARLKD